MGKEEFIYLVIKKMFVLEIINAAKGQLISKGPKRTKRFFLWISSLKRGWIKKLKAIYITN